MIRIDEIYTAVFWAWIKKNRPSTRLFCFYPFGRTDPDSIVSYQQDPLDYNFTLFFDQEPINLARHKDTFTTINLHEMNVDCWGPCQGHLITSEKDSDSVDQLCEMYGWKSHYYFFHGWAALDWYRGYNHAFLMPDPKDRTITKTFIMPNRIVAGEREHRLIMLYHIFKSNMTNNWISCPAVCPGEGIDIQTAAKKISAYYHDAEEVFAQQQFPIEFPNESDSPMHSYCLSLFDECADSLLYLVSETVATGRRLHLTEKIFKPICLRMPFVVAGTRGSLAYLRSYGFKTFSHLWDESYDDEVHDHQRLEKLAWTLKALDVLPAEEKQRLFNEAQEVCEHNYNHFYNGGFEKILWAELEGMLNEF